MSEHHKRQSSEHYLPSLEDEKMLPEGEHEKLLEAGRLEQDQQLSAARQEVFNEAAEHNEVKKVLEANHDSEDNLPDERTALSNDLKEIVKRRELESIQRRENGRDRALSKIIHQPAIRMMSEAAASTVGRPSGLLGGGLVALIGSSAYYYLSSHIGLKYNYSIFLLLFVGGFTLGVTLEIVLRMLAISRRRNI